ncbi:hypothetical protein CJ030_MR7G001001 [Morella rubra]|uniref:Uncharacterized protein n=1 Tax=Morella rubra TaxID=262757 RepID=A0A6A1V9M9_9ROSI|nr:hypothetical protein CJ030_MR7G001001 [Morella rubra]
MLILEGLKELLAKEDGVMKDSLHEWQMTFRFFEDPGDRNRAVKMNRTSVPHLLPPSIHPLSVLEGIEEGNKGFKEEKMMHTSTDCPDNILQDLSWNCMPILRLLNKNGRTDA